MAKNLVLCSSNEESKNLIWPDCSIIYCSENWREKQKKIFGDNCYDNCSIIGKY